MKSNSFAKMEEVSFFIQHFPMLGEEWPDLRMTISPGKRIEDELCDPDRIGIRGVAWIEVCGITLDRHNQVSGWSCFRSRAET